MTAAPEPDMRAWGRATPAELERLVVVSPHLDDAVLGCGRLLAVHPGATVVTVFTGRPTPPPDPPTAWDVQCGFGPGDDVLGAREAEDAAALAVLDCTPEWLGFVEYQYLPRDRWVDGAAIADTLEATLRALDPTAVLVPFGLANPDHVATHDAAMTVRARYGDPAWFCYQDLGYHYIPGLLARAVARLFLAGVWPTPAALPNDPDPTRRDRALACYRSQLPALEADWGLAAKLAAPAVEQYWRLAPPPPGWEHLGDVAGP